MTKILLANLTDMPRYQCHKIVQALKIQAVELVEAIDQVRLTFEDPDYAPLLLSREWYNRAGPAAGGYFVLYPDGYQSYSPAKAFEEGYTRIAEG